MNNPFDIKKFSMGEDQGPPILNLGEESRSPVKAKKPLSLYGNIPMTWVLAAANTPGKGFHVAIALWHQKNLRKSTRFKMSGKHVKDFGVSRNAISRALKSLSSVGIISIEQQQGQSPIVSILQSSNFETELAQHQNNTSDQRKVTRVNREEDL